MKNDLISRHAAIDALGEKQLAWIAGEYEAGLQNKWESDVEALKELPSVQPERKRGKWIYSEDEYGIDGYHCDECGFFVPWDYTHKFINYIEDYHFCPNCGADMRGEQDDSF